MEILAKHCTEEVLETHECILNIHGIEVDSATIDRSQPHITINLSRNDLIKSECHILCRIM